VAVAVTNNTIEASTGTGVKVDLTSGNDQDGSMTVNADNGATTRVIAGSISAAPAKAAVGATVAVLVDSDKVTASLGRQANVNAEGDYTQTATTSGDVQLFTGAMAVAVSGNAVGGAVNVIVTKNTTESSVGNNSKITSGGSGKVASKTDFDLMVISGSANVAAGGSVAAGGTVNVIVDKAKSNTKLGHRQQHHGGEGSHPDLRRVRSAHLRLGLRVHRGQRFRQVRRGPGERDRVEV
jgi:hypothetical protein